MNNNSTHHKIPTWYLLMLFSLFSGRTTAQTVEIVGQKIISTPTQYTDSVIHLNHGSFLIKNQSTLTITHSIIEGTVSPDNSNLFNITNGTLILRNNSVNIYAKNIHPAPNIPPQFTAITLQNGHMTLIDNTFRVDKPYSVGLLMTGASATSGINITGNQIHQFHGGIIAQNSSNAHINKNTFSHVSCGNIYFKKSYNIDISGNNILFSGNNNVGDSLDLIDSKNINISLNHIYSSSCYSIFIMRSQDIKIYNNSIIGGITYAIYATTETTPDNPSKKYLITLEKLIHPDDSDRINENIIVKNNYLSQNRFGLGANTVNGLNVTNNRFIQRFKNDKDRLFWTNNSTLLHHIQRLEWIGNTYKEAFTQDESGDNSRAHQPVSFPEHNGVMLP